VFDRRLSFVVLALNPVASGTAAALQGPRQVLRVDGSRNFDEFGRQVAVIGDVDGDHVPDVLVGAWKADPGGVTDAGSACLCSGADGHVLRTHDGSTASEHFGFALAALDDVDGDRLPDYAVGGYLADTVNGARSGRVVVYASASVQPIELLGPAADDRFGYAVAGIDDLDGDGARELAVGAIEDSASNQRRGRVYVFSGRTRALHHVVAGPAASPPPTGSWQFGAAVSRLGDIDNDGVPEFLVGADPGGASTLGAAHVVSGSMGTIVRSHAGPFAQSGFARALTTPGDVDNDGRLDYAVGVPFARDPSGRSVGAVTMFSGATGSELWTRLGQQPPSGETSDQFGAAVAGIGDVDCDGDLDLAVGAPYQNSLSAPDAGAVWILDGPTGTAIAVLEGSEAAALLGSSVAWAQDLDRDGAPDVLCGAPLMGFGSAPDRGAVLGYAITRCTADVVTPRFR